MGINNICSRKVAIISVTDHVCESAGIRIFQGSSVKEKRSKYRTATAYFFTQVPCHLNNGGFQFEDGVTSLYTCREDENVWLNSRGQLTVAVVTASVCAGGLQLVTLKAKHVTKRYHWATALNWSSGTNLATENGREIWKMEYQLCSLKITTKELWKNKFSSGEKRTSNGTIANETRVKKLWYNCSIQQRTKKSIQSFG